ncbi:hypothetical protein SMSP2_02617 [Limihaloglobus sulfuriphilus]|uniref:Glycoside hydrolase family 42 N-terminal domain-containing protein n=1 Tax=Limihaloglobus sulfuriphilus TaxID=1851148 RepID=A0A1R7T634_9BACT|nr:hypothetical protein [Limihaloglobus sulfuriphilus]AQQ72236.1 hypothetical protein SMSP2_02617 [Limihaloglobus sulfuriphilus]
MRLLTVFIALAAFINLQSVFADYYWLSGSLGGDGLGCPDKAIISAEPPAGADVCGSIKWWDKLLRIAQTSDANEAEALNAEVAFNGFVNDPTWGLYGQKLSERLWNKTQADQAGLKSITYFETFGECATYIAELDPVSTSPDYNTVSRNHWSWQLYSGNEIVWVGVHNWFDDEEFARPWTRTHPVYGGSPMTYPDGTAAAGYLGDSSDPRNSRVYDAGCSKDILGRVFVNYEYNSLSQAAQNGQLYVPSDRGDYAGHLRQGKDTACPAWIDYAYASALHATGLGLHGMWTDNYGPWDNFNSKPVQHAFGEWSVALFRNHLSDNFTAGELADMGVSDVMTFDIRQRLKSIAAGWGWDIHSTDLNHSAWKDSRWQNEPLWQAYLIFKRRVGTAALTNYDAAVHAAAGENGIEDFAVLGNGVPLFNLGWTRGNLDMVSTEISAGWGLGSGSRGFTLPPFGRISPAYRLARQQSRSRFVNVWFYNSGYEDYLKHDTENGYRANRNVCRVLYSEMLSSNTLPMLLPSNPRETGDPSTNSQFFGFVSQVDNLFSRRCAVEDVGIYYSSSSILNQYFPGGIRDFDNQPHQFSNWGWATALGQLHFQYRFVPEWKLSSEALDGLKVLIIGESEVFDGDDVSEILYPWVESGGRLIVTGRSGNRRGEEGNFAVNPAGYSLSMLTGVSDISSAPASQLLSVGQGKVYYIKDNIGMDYYNAAALQRASMLSDFSNYMDTILAGTDAVIESSDSNLDENIGLTLYEDICGGKLFVDIVNYNIELETDKMTNTPPFTFDAEMPQWLEGKEFTVSTVSPDAVDAAFADAESIPGRIQITAPSISFYASIVISLNLEADINGDLRVDFADYAVMASKWLEASCYAGNDWCGGADIDLSSDVGAADVLGFAAEWLDGN